MEGFFFAVRHIFLKEKFSPTATRTPFVLRFRSDAFEYSTGAAAMREAEALDRGFSLVYIMDTINCIA